MTCPVCNDERMVIVAGPDEFGMYDADDCPCQMKEVRREEERHEEEVEPWTLDQKVVASLKIINQAVAEHNPSHVFGLFSGGHDSLTATSIAALHPLFTAAVFIDTGTAIPDTVEFVRETCREQGWPLKVYKAPDSYEDLVMRFGFPGKGGHGLMYQRLKERALDALVRDHKTRWNDRVLFISGVRSDESVRRMKAKTHIHRDGATVWVPVIHDWSKVDCARHIERCGLKRNSVSDKIHRSGECNCGAFAKPREIEELELWFPEFAAEIHALEEKARAAGVPGCVWGQDPPKVHRDQMALQFGHLEPGHLCEDCPVAA